MSAQNTQQPQKQPHKQRHHAKSLIPVNPLMMQKIPIEHQQCLHQNQHLQQQYHYPQQSQPQMGALYNRQALYPHLEQQCQGIPPGNYQYWYSPQVFHHNAALSGIISPPFYQQQNGAQSQLVSAGQPQIKPATKARSCPAVKDQAQTTTIPGRPKASAPLYIPPKTAPNCGLNKIDSISSFQNYQRSHVRNSEQDMGIYQMDMKQKKKKHGKEKEIIKKEIDHEKVKPNLGNGASSLFRRLAYYMRFRSVGKPKAKKNGYEFNDVVSQGSSTCSSPKKRGLLRRLFGEAHSCSQAQSKLGCHFHYPTNVPTDNIDQKEVREAEDFQKLQAARQSKKRIV